MGRDDVGRDVGSGLVMVGVRCRCCWRVYLSVDGIRVLDLS